MTKETKSGLFHGDVPVSLEGVHVRAKLAGTCVDVTVTQRYRNREAVPIEAVYVFPLDERAAVCGFAALVGGALLKGCVGERDAAFATYDDAMERGDGAFLLDQERPNVFTASVGNLRPGEAVELQVRYVGLAARDGNAIRLNIPTTVSPRFVPHGPPEIGETDGERLNPPHWPSVPYGLTLGVTISGDRVAKVESPSHPIRLSFEDGTVTAELSREGEALDRDFVLLVERKQPEAPEVRVARERDGRRVVMVTFFPEFEARDHGHEVLFLLDCSGSMKGESIEQARRALSLCVRGLHVGDTFNVVRFGSRFQMLWNAPREYGDDTLEEATRYVANIDADLDGTEILPPLAALLESKYDEARPRRVLLLTDGQVSNEDEVLALARKHADRTRIFTFGIGASASEHLVRGTARASRGASEMIFPGERIEPKVLRTFERVRMPACDDAHIDWKGLTCEQAPSRLPPVFAGDALTVFARIDSGLASEVELTFGGRRLAIPIELELADPSDCIPILWAREVILELEDLTMRRGSSQQRPDSDAGRRARLLELGKRYGLVNSATSCVAVEERSPSDRGSPRARHRKIPTALTAGWGGSPATRGSPAPAALLSSLVSAHRPATFESREGYIAARAILLGGAPRPRTRGPEVTTNGEALLAEEEPLEDVVYAVLMTQRADGSFPVSEFLLALLGPKQLKGIMAFRGAAQVRIATSLVVAVLERDHRHRESLWRPGVRKAKAWLESLP